MNERLIRTSLDQALLAIGALEYGLVDVAQVHATLAGALSQPETPTVVQGARGPQLGNRPSNRAGDDVVEQWFIDIETLNAPPQPEGEGEVEVGSDLDTDPDSDPVETIPVQVIGDHEPPGRARARARREARQQP